MRNFVLILIILALFAITGCNSNSKYATKVVKPKYRHTWFDKKQDRKAKRVKMVKMRS